MLLPCKNLLKIATVSAVIVAAASACVDKSAATPTPEKDFLKVDGHNIVNSKGEAFYIKGTNLGNWCNPEGYMFGFSRANSYSMINDVMTQLFGPTDATEFWKKFKKNYFTADRHSHRCSLHFHAHTRPTSLLSRQRAPTP